MNPREEFLRSECACSKCVACCKAMPGMLIPGDPERILVHLPLADDATVSAQDLAKHSFVASEGALVVYQGQPMRIPTIVPAQKPDGSCVFLEGNRCTIHAFAPYGCSHFDQHQTRSEGDARSTAGLRAILSDQGSTYFWLWRFLLENGCTAPPLKVRRARLSCLLESLEVDDAEKPVE